MKTDFLYQSKYGLFIHWSSYSLNKDDTKRMTDCFKDRFKLYEKAVEDFDVDIFVEQVHETGADFVIFTLNHADFVLPFYLKEFEEMLPNRVIKRDLLKEIIDGLKKYNIKLIAYYNGDGFKDVEWQNYSEFHSNPQKHAEICYKITKAISDKYKEDIAGWWIDGCYLIDYNNRCGTRYDFKKYKECLTSGNKNAIVAFNINGAEPWEFDLKGISDYQAGELYELDRYPNGRFSGEGGSEWFSCCYMDDNWVHEDPGEVKSRYTNEEVINYIKKVNKLGGTFAYNLALYRNGVIPEAERKQLSDVRDEITRSNNVNEFMKLVCSN